MSSSEKVHLDYGAKKSACGGKIPGRGPHPGYTRSALRVSKDPAEVTCGGCQSKKTFVLYKAGYDAATSLLTGKDKSPCLGDAEDGVDHVSMMRPSAVLQSTGSGKRHV
jgi:hypothetical protein